MPDSRPIARTWRFWASAIFCPLIGPPMSALAAIFFTRGEAVLRWADGRASPQEVYLLADQTARMVVVISILGAPFMWAIALFIGLPLLALISRLWKINFLSINLVCIAIAVGFGSTIFTNTGSHIGPASIAEAVWYALTGLFIGTSFYYASGAYRISRDVTRDTERGGV